MHTHWCQGTSGALEWSMSATGNGRGRSWYWPARRMYGLASPRTRKIDDNISRAGYVEVLPLSLFPKAQFGSLAVVTMEKDLFRCRCRDLGSWARRAFNSSEFRLDSRMSEALELMKRTQATTGAGRRRVVRAWVNIVCILLDKLSSAASGPRVPLFWPLISYTQRPASRMQHTTMLLPLYAREPMEDAERVQHT